MTDRPLDLRGEEEKKSSFTISRSTAIFASAVLGLAGLAVALILPELTAEETSVNRDPYSTPLSVLLTTTTDEIVTDDAVYTDVQVPVAYMIMFREGSLNMTGADGKLSEYLDFLLEDEIGFRLTISTGQGWNRELSHTVSGGERSEGPTDASEQEVVVDLEDDLQITLNFELEVWEGTI